MSIYLDVTSACQSGLNTGVKRMQRGMHAWLSRRHDYIPVYWQAALRAYRKLDESDVRNLEEPPGFLSGWALHDAFTPGIFRDWANYFHDRSRHLALPRALRAGDMLLVPDLLWDNRGAFFQRPCAPGVLRVGVFHDAIALRYPEQSRIDAYACARGVKALARFDRVVCVSLEAEADLHFFWKKFGEKPVPTHVVPWPVPFAQERPASRSNFGAREILCVARLEPHKNHLRLLESCELLWREGLEFRLRLIGCKAYPDVAWKIQRRVKVLQSAGRDVQWAAHVPEDALHQAYQACSFTIFPSLREGFGLPIIESLWHSRPVVCGQNGALGEVAAGGGCETGDMSDAGAMASRLRRLFKDRARYDELFSQAQVRTLRTWPQYWSELFQATGYGSK